MKLSKDQFDDLAAQGLRPQNHDLQGFAEAVYDTNSFMEAVETLSGSPDKSDMQAWGINADQWRTAVQKALETAMFDFENETV